MEHPFVNMEKENIGVESAGGNLFANTGDNVMHVKSVEEHPFVNTIK